MLICKIMVVDHPFGRYLLLCYHRDREPPGQVKKLCWGAISKAKGDAEIQVAGAKRKAPAHSSANHSGEEARARGGGGGKV